MPIEHISDTAMWVAAFRARESERPNAIFSDPFARRLAGERGEALTRTMPHGAVMAMAIAVRTRALDEVIMTCVERHGVDLVINLAAGLDTRPYRLPLPASLRWVEVDFPELLDYKENLLSGEPYRCDLERIPLDLANVAARRELLPNLGARSERCLIVTEGLLCYLEAGQVAALAADLHAVPGFKYWAMDLIHPAVLARAQASLQRHLAQGNARLQFAPAEGSAFFQPFGWSEVLFRSAFDDGRTFGREMPFAWFWRLVARLAPAERREAYRRMSGIAWLQRT